MGPMIDATERQSRVRAADPAGSASDAPAFRIRFSRAQGLAALFEQSTNSFHWVGYGTVHVHDRGLIITARRRHRAGLLRRDKLEVSATDIENVYREAAAVQVTLRGSHRGSFFRFSASDAATAATIVRLLPTTRTLELENVSLKATRETWLTSDQPAADANRSPGYNLRRRVLPALLAAGALLAWPAWRLIHAVGASTRAPSEATSPGVMTTAPATGSGSHAARVSSAVSTDALDVQQARVDLDRFDSRIEGLKSEFSLALSALMDGSLARQDFIDGLNRWLLPQWQTLDNHCAPLAQIPSRRRIVPPLTIRRELLQKRRRAPAAAVR
jgi:hypothetical protein